MSGLSVKLPLAIDDHDGFYKLNKRFIDLVKQNFKMVLLTNPGERIMDPGFGCGLNHSLFQQNAGGERLAIEEKIRFQVARYLPYVSLNNVNISVIENGNGVFLEIGYYIVPLGIADLVSLIFDESVA